MSRRRDQASSSMAAAAMSLVQLERWLQDRTERRPVATSMPVLDGYVAAIVAGPVSISPLDWICPLLAIDADAFNHGGTPEFAAISAVVQHHNAISNTLSTNPRSVRADPSAQAERRRRCASLVPGFHAAMQPRISAWAPLLDTRNINHGLLLPILLHCVDDQGRPLLGPTRKGRQDRRISAQRPHRYPGGRRGHAPILDADPLLPALADYCLRGCSCRLPMRTQPIRGDSTIATPSLPFKPGDRKWGKAPQPKQKPSRSDEIRAAKAKITRRNSLRKQCEALQG